MSSDLTVPVQVALDLLKQGYKYLDVRTEEEFASGHVEGAVNIPYMFRDEAGMKKNPNFVEEVSKKFEINDNFIVGCQSGRRSLMAANELIAADFKCVKDMAGGMTAWIQGGLNTCL